MTAFRVSHAPIRSLSLSLSLSLFSSLARSLAALGVIAVAAGSAVAAPQWQKRTFNFAPNGGTYPVDCATTPNNNRAAVRYANPNLNDPVISVWTCLQTVPPGQALLATFDGSILNLKSGNQTTVNLNNLRAYQPSDRVELTNWVGVSIGSGDSLLTGSVPNDETYVEFFDIATPAFVTQYVFSNPPSSTYDYDHFGLTNDLAISRDGGWVVVSSDNWIHVFDIGQFPQIALTSFNIGGFDYATSTPWNRPCSPNLAVDSVAMTNERAVVTTARLSTLTTPPTYTTWVYIVDLTTGTPAISLQQEIVPGHWSPEGDDQDRPHDIAITSARLQDRFAIVTTTHGVAAFDLSSDTMRGTYFNANDWRKYQKQVDSVEVTDEDVLVISDNDSSGTMQWQVRQFKINPATGMVLWQSHAPSGPPTESHAHDLAIDLGFDKAIVRATNDNVCFRGLGTATQVVNVLVSPNSSDAYAYEQFRASPYNFNIFSSDAAVISPQTGSNPQIWAATIGGYVDPTTLLWTGAVDLIDLNAGTLGVSQVPIAPNAGPGCVPVDIAISASHTEVVVRSADPNPETPPATGPDFVRISLTVPPAIAFNYGGHGTVMGLDSLAVQPGTGFVGVLKRVLSISEQEGTSSGSDYTHIDK